VLDAREPARWQGRDADEKVAGTATWLTPLQHTSKMNVGRGHGVLLHSRLIFFCAVITSVALRPSTCLRFQMRLAGFSTPRPVN
jgi:hypothetical protein